MPRITSSRLSLAARLGSLAAACVALPTLLACLDHPLKPVEYDAVQEDMEGIQITLNKDVDILFVIDDSGSMGEEQTNLSENFGRFLSVLEDPEVKANYRIGITTTDNSNPWCNTSSEAGNLVFSSCLSRLPDFIFQGATEVNAEAACTDFCPPEWASIEQTETVTADDPTPRKRPWLENIEGLTNLPDGLDTTTALQCLGPQGISGCGFEQPLESMYKTFTRAAKSPADEDEAGFVRDSAILSVIFVTDEADCSHNTSYDSIFLPDGMKTFWSDPANQQSPTSAVCWNAGVECVGDSGTYSECNAVNLDPAGNPVSDPDAAVLRPVSRYINLLQGIEDQKRDINPSQEVLVAAIAGVPDNYPDAEIQYRDTPGGTTNDPNFQENFGIGPGCTSTVAEAVPPVRLREFAEAFQVGGVNNLFSVCATDYTVALEAIADQIRDQIQPACMPACVADVDTVTGGLQTQCVLTQIAPQDDGTKIESTIKRCVNGDQLPDGEDVCYVSLTDDGSSEKTTPEEFDDMSIECIEAGWNLEFRVIRREGVPAPAGTQVSATCQLSQNKAQDCPNLP